MINNHIERIGEWLELDPYALATALGSKPPEAGSHAHELRQWLLACSLFPAKWVNRLFSVGGIRWSPDGRIGLLAFPATDAKHSDLYRHAAKDAGLVVPPVLYEDDYCLVFDKPAGMPVHESYAGQAGTLDMAAAKHMMNQGDPLPVRHIHRLDDDTSGPVLYSKNDLAQLRLDEAMRDKRIDRLYIAVVHGRLRQQKGTIDAPIGKDRHHKSRRRVSPAGETAVTRYERIRSFDRFSVARVELETGRTHQIRVHMSHIGHPLLGDTLYGGFAAGGLNHQALHGEKLVFPHPLTGDMVEADSPWPAWLRKLYNG
ncbi:RluA family pseudouridine synthase [Paenibacillus sp. LHD-117]|uniref:RluA family pseudouridine synthase n=1 Tax=Paenibacillus sp. LHD-117 TaxID=3071412 RepID=UPI0027DF552E|nr:RluA family pseudouridine synthase [Paenibacillus sp. LHD-117]MDQ6418638.1 RluA family pseudouridine synthase [Paenibacillus sp. LHD-117]